MRILNDDRNAINLGSCIAGIPVTLHYSFFLLLLIEFLNSLRYTSHPMFILFVAVLYGPLLLVTILVHEYGHALATIKLGGQAHGIILWPLGGFAVCGPSDSLFGDLKVALAGPLTHIPMAFIWWAVFFGLSGGEEGIVPGLTIHLGVLSNSAKGFFKTLAAEGFYMNIILLCFNLFIPAFPLDGGRIYAASLILCGLTPRRAAIITSVTAMFIATAMVIYSVISFLSGTGASGLLLGLVGIFIFHSGYDLYGIAKTEELRDHPIFGRECYSGDRRSEGEDSGVADAVNAPRERPVAAQSDSAALA